METKQTVKQRYFEIVNSIGAVQRNAQNPFAKSKYATLSNIQQHLQPMLYNASLVLLFDFGRFDDQVYRITLTLQDVETVESMVFNFAVPIDNTQKNAVQAFGSTTTYAQRYALCVAFQIALDDTDPDAQAAPKPAQQQAAPAVQKTVLKVGTKQYDNAVIHLAKSGSKMTDITAHYVVPPTVEAKLVQDSMELQTSKPE